MRVWFSRAFGFGLSMALLVAASLLVIPSMVRASGSNAWGSIAVGQSVGGIGAVLVGFGWFMSGPAKVAGASASQRRREYLESLRARVLLFLPLGLLLAGVSAFVAHNGFWWMAAVGSISATAVGLTGSWYFVGLAEPYSMLVWDTAPRVLGSLLAVLVMKGGGSAGAGVACQLIGILAACSVTSLVVIRSPKGAGIAEPRRSLRAVLNEQRHGVMTTAASSAIAATPLVIVQLLRPDIQPSFALADKLQRQITAAMSPFVTVLQGWVPRGNLRRRSRQALFAALVVAILLLVGVASFGSSLVDWLGGGVIVLPPLVILLMAALVGVGVLETIVSHAILTANTMLNVAARATLWSGVITIVLMTPGAYLWGTAGGLLGVLIALFIRALWETVAGLAKSTEEGGGTHEGS